MNSLFKLNVTKLVIVIKSSISKQERIEFFQSSASCMHDSYKFWSTYHTYSNRGRPQIQADSNTNRNPLAAKMTQFLKTLQELVDKIKLD